MCTGPASLRSSRAAGSSSKLSKRNTVGTPPSFHLLRGLHADRFTSPSSCCYFLVAHRVGQLQVQRREGLETPLVTGDLFQNCEQRHRQFIAQSFVAIEVTTDR